MQDLSKDSIKSRHWEEVKTITKTDLKYESDLFKLEDMLKADLLAVKEEVSEIADYADKQLRIEEKLKVIIEYWENEQFEFAPYKARDNV